MSEAFEAAMDDLPGDPTINPNPGEPIVPAMAFDDHETATFHPMGIGDVRSDAKGSGARFNGGKPDYSLIPLSTMEDEARVWMYGKSKYAAWNWAKGMPWSAPYSSLMRHLAAWQKGEDLDSETGLPHLAHAMCNLRMLALYSKTYQEGDDRPKEFLS